MKYVFTHACYTSEGNHDDDLLYEQAMIVDLTPEEAAKFDENFEDICSALAELPAEHIIGLHAITEPDTDMNGLNRYLEQIIENGHRNG